MSKKLNPCRQTEFRRMWTSGKPLHEIGKRMRMRAGDVMAERVRLGLNGRGLCGRRAAGSGHGGSHGSVSQVREDDGDVVDGDTKTSPGSGHFRGSHRLLG